MESTGSAATSLLQLGILMGIVLAGHAVAMRRLPIEIVPGVLKERMLLCNKLRPWLSVAALAMTMTGLILLLG